MNLFVALMVVAVTLIGALAWLANNFIRVKHGYPTDEELAMFAARADRQSTEQIRLLTDENGRLQNKVDRLEDRLAVLERIATDPAERTAREIEQLR